MSFYKQIQILKEIAIKKEATLEKIRLIDRQLQLIYDFEEENKLEKNIVQNIILQIKSIEQKTEKEEIKKIMSEKNIGDNLTNIFQDEIEIIRKLIQELKSTLLQEKENYSKTLNEQEITIIVKIEKTIALILNIEGKLKRYLANLKKLNYNKKYRNYLFNPITLLVKNILFSIKVEGLANIPKNGPCIIVSNHYHGTFDMPILYAVIKRPIYVFTNYNFMLHVKPFETIFHKAGVVVAKGDDKKYPQRTKKAIKKEIIDSIPSTDITAIKKCLIHLKNGDALIIFPEGDSYINPTYQRNEGQMFIEPKNGFIEICLLAKKTENIDVPIIPIGINYKKGIIRKQVIINIGTPEYIDYQINTLSKNQKKEQMTKKAVEIFEKCKQLALTAR